MLQMSFSKSDILLFDLDGTLIDTDLANNAAYQYAADSLSLSLSLLVAKPKE
ncbi:hypothetical protein [Helicobacter sp. MIT 05-5294]|uniref:hypothetical protein n=1 Tax=Helicobacter sp. MIT 05-5294 TaxID=1548150 RepID=UPI0018833164|nr:hypothetical protein [Helicobacter sp. MIT 05-5294]